MTSATPLGEVLRDDQGIRLEFVRTYDDPITHVWSALTEPDRVARWFGTWSGDPATGTIDVVMTAEDGATAEPMTIVECAPPTRLAVEVPTPDGAWQLSVTLRAEGDKTVLVFVQRLAEPYDASSIGPGWHFYLDRLGAVVTGEPVPQQWDDYYPALSDSYPVPD